MYTSSVHCTLYVYSHLARWSLVWPGDGFLFTFECKQNGCNWRDGVPSVSVAKVVGRMLDVGLQCVHGAWRGVLVYDHIPPCAVHPFVLKKSIYRSCLELEVPSLELRPPIPGSSINRPEFEKIQKVINT